MLMQLGSVVFDVVRFNTHEHSRSSEAGFAEKSVLGKRPPLEYVGDGPETISIRGKIYPRKLGGLEGLAALEAARASGAAQFLMRGDGTPLGFFVIESVNESSHHLWKNGVGQKITFDISLKRSDAPSPMGYFASIFGMLGG